MIQKKKNISKRYPGRNEVLQVVDLKVNIDTNRFGGIGFQHTGTTGSGATLIKNYSVEWK